MKTRNFGCQCIWHIVKTTILGLESSIKIKPLGMLPGRRKTALSMSALTIMSLKVENKLFQAQGEFGKECTSRWLSTSRKGLSNGFLKEEYKQPLAPIVSRIKKFSLFLSFDSKMWEILSFSLVIHDFSFIYNNTNI